ncbi:MAG: hypothetical protein L0H23_11160, partial [Luteimonas sp.]|nr:hypothetical protein [Luteimonas sp.]
MLDIAADTRIQDVLASLDKTLASRDIEGALELFAEECYWRDFLSFTWNLKTVEGKDEIRDMLEQCLDRVQPSDWSVYDTDFANHADGVTEGFITFDTPIAGGYGYIRLKDGLIWTLFTTMVDLKGYEETGSHTRPLGARHGEHQGDPTWLEAREAELAELGVSAQPYVLIVGGGQGGIGLAARLRQHGVPALIVEKNARAGDSWRKRYKSLSLHDPIWYDHMPYLKFPDNWPVFSPKDKIG